jgi:hypothetical protein
MQTYKEDNVDFHRFGRILSHGKETLGVSIFVGGTQGNLNATPPIPRTAMEFSEDEQRYVAEQCRATFEGLEMLRAKRALQEKPEIVAIHDEVVQELKDCFPANIFVKEIPNGYCNRACCVHLPWLVVTTNRGPITIGWRKRVISIGWESSEVKKTANELFPDEDVTKLDHLIHAWSIADAKKYINVILGS